MLGVLSDGVFMWFWCDVVQFLCVRVFVLGRSCLCREGDVCVVNIIFGIIIQFSFC